MSFPTDKTWDYGHAGLNSGAPTFSKDGRCVGINVVNTSSSASASFKINGGDTITLLASQSMVLNPWAGKLRAPTLTWVSGDMIATMEVLL